MKCNKKSHLFSNQVVNGEGPPQVRRSSLDESSAVGAGHHVSTLTTSGTGDGEI